MELDKKETYPTNMESMQWMIKHLMNEIIYLKKKMVEGKKPFKPFIKKITNIDTSPQIPLTSRINLEDYAMDNFVILIMQITLRKLVWSL